MEVLVKKLMVTLIAVGVVSFAASSPAAAQNGGDVAIVKVPFQFIAGDRLLPPGSYRIDSLTADWGVVRISSLGREPISVFVSTNNAGAEKQPTNDAKVKFVVYHRQYFLQWVALPGRDAREIEMSPAGAERTLAKLNLLTSEPAASAR